MTEHDLRRVAPFGHPRFNACLRLLVAFRSLPRPSSALGAKASTVCPCSLDFKLFIAYYAMFLLLVKSLRQLSLSKEVFLSSSVCSFQGTLEVAIAPSKLNDASRCDRP